MEVKSEQGNCGWCTRVDLFWYMFNWVGNISGDEIGNSGYEGFVFPVVDFGVTWSEMVGPEKKLMRKRMSSLVKTMKTQAPVSFCWHCCHVQVSSCGPNRAAIVVGVIGALVPQPQGQVGVAMEGSL